ncbi:hypothetical protein T492DRAFT_963066 [Pavlovales sp. CCMP2436]|nr:hypothetical protein T492DRAFT_963066 [Pavlovales sp. CCMP2436]
MRHPFHHLSEPTHTNRLHPHDCISTPTRLHLHTHTTASPHDCISTAPPPHARRTRHMVCSELMLFFPRKIDHGSSKAGQLL